MNRQTQSRIDVDGIPAELILKKIENIHIRVYPPDGTVRITAPARMKLETIMTFAVSRADWIRTQQDRLRSQPKPVPVQFQEGEIHYVWGTPYPLNVVEGHGATGVSVQADKLVLRVRPGSDPERRRAAMDDWYRDQIRDALPQLIEKWQPVMGVRVDDFFVQRMKTRWGTCIPRKRRIRINTELARHRPEHLEYVVIHELAHLLEPSHGPRFVALMDRFAPGWKSVRRAMNVAPIPRADRDW